MNSFQRAMAMSVALNPTHILAQNNTSELAPVVVTARKNLEQDSLDAAQERIKKLPGGSSVITPDEWTGRTLAPEEIFQFDPGVFARSRGVGNDTRISVRGSGLQRQFGDRGLTLLLDGIPANDADGSFYFRAIDPFSISHIESYRGANGLAYGGTQLGGAINIVQKNGLNTPGTNLNLEWGDFNTYRSHLSYGGATDRWDWYAGYSYTESDGYRDRQAWRSHHFNGNLGYHWSDSAVTRFYFLYSESDAELVGSLTEQEFDENPRQAQPGLAPGVDRDLVTIRFGQRTEWNTSSGDWSFYTNYQYLDFDHLINEGSVFGFNRLVDFDTDEAQIGLRGNHDYSLFGRDHTLRINTAANYGRNQENGFTTLFGPVNQDVLIDRENTASNFSIYLENDTTFANKHHLIIGGGYVHSRREVSLNSGDFTGDTSGIINDEGFVYRLGYLYELSDDVQFFANFSQSFEGSPFAEVGVSLDPGSETLEPQFARTFEIGTRFENDWASGELTLYRANVDDEFIDEQLPGAFTSTTTNLDAIHQGIEAALTLNLSEIANWSGGPALYLDQSYQLNDFEIDEGVNEGNQLPGVSRHVYTGRLRAEDRNGAWKLALSAEWLPDGFIADNENQIETSGFINWRLSGEVRLREGASLYGGIDNLFDESFVNSVVVNPSSGAFINPANGRSAYVGLKFKF